MLALLFILGFGLLALLTSIPMYIMKIKDTRITAIRSALRNGGIIFIIISLILMIIHAIM